MSSALNGFVYAICKRSKEWDLNKKKVEELLCLLVFVWSSRSEIHVYDPV